MRKFIATAVVALSMTFSTTTSAQDVESFTGIGVRLDTWKNFQPFTGSGLEPKNWQAKPPTTENSVVIKSLICDGPAYDAGLRFFDHIISINGETVPELLESDSLEAQVNPVVEMIAKVPAGEDVSIVVYNENRSPNIATIVTTRVHFLNPEFPFFFTCEDDISFDK